MQRTNPEKLTQVRHTKGLSLIELMISLAMGAIILLGLVAMASNSSQTDAEVARVARQLDNARYALHSLNESISHAGYYSYFTDIIPITSGTNLPAGTVDDQWSPCESDIGKFDDAVYNNEVMSLALQGYEGAASSPLSCIANTDYQPGTDVVMVRRLSSRPISDSDGDGDLSDEIPATSDEEKDTIWVQTVIGEDPKFQLGKDSDKFDTGEGWLDKIDGTVMPARRFVIEIYFVSPCNRFESTETTCTAGADDGDPIPTLKRLRLNVSDGNPATAFEVEPIAEGIENMQLQYGLDTTDPTTFIPPGAPHPFGAPDEYRSAGHTNLNETSEWATVVTARVLLLARNRDGSAGYSDPKTYALTDGVTFTPTGAAASYRRNIYTRTITITNPSSRRQTEFRG